VKIQQHLKSILWVSCALCLLCLSPSSHVALNGKELALNDSDKGAASVCLALSNIHSPINYECPLQSDLSCHIFHVSWNPTVMLTETS